ncbi:dienelactone hydrolase family protein [Haliangium sp.]|uniref:dienelactone hydrolase family protein n=1 Tax=Haliangium sp. TaxID=2663208 RepID=UPI003D0AC310
MSLLVALPLSACGPKSTGESAVEPTPETTEEATPVATAEPAEPAGVTAANWQDRDSIVGEEVTYEAGGVSMKGYLAYDRERAGKRPGVLVVHEWWGHNDYARQRARMLADLGYTALAVDMYGDGKQADHPETAMKFSAEVYKNQPQAKARFEAALALLKQHETVNPEQTAAIGYCFGGAVVLHMARMGVDLDGVVSFHGNLATQNPAEPGQVQAKVLVCHGGADAFVKPEQVSAFEQEMQAADVDYEVKVYEGATHSFTSPEATAYGERFELPLVYDEAGDRQSWSDMQAFFDQIFAQP